jgi:small GTP-binding protein
MKRSHIDSELTSLMVMPPKKIVLLGDSSIGKSTLFDRINKLTDTEYTFPKIYKATDHFDFNRINIKTNTGNIIIDLWDTAGQESRGGLLRDAYLKGADSVLLLYDVSEMKTIENIPKWLDQIKKVSPNVPVAVIGNKSDKFNDLQQSEVVKLRECNLIRDVGHNKIKNYLISIKENTHLEFISSMFNSKITVKETEGCMIGLEYVLSKIFNKPIIIKY